MSSTADTTTSTMVPIPRRIQPDVVVCTGPGESRGGRRLPSDFATVDGHRECHGPRAFVIRLVENWASPEAEPVDEFLHVLKDSFSHDEVWPQPYDHLYVSLRSGRSVGKEPDADERAEPALQFDTEHAVEPENLEPLTLDATTVKPEDLELEPVPSDEIMAEDPHQPDMHLDDAGNEPDMPADTNDLPDVSMDRPLRVTFGKELRYAPIMAELIRCRRHRDGTLQSVPLPKVGSNMPYPSSLKGTHCRVHRHYQCKDLTSTAVWAAAY